MVGLIGPNLEVDGEIGLLCSGKARYAEVMTDALVLQFMECHSSGNGLWLC